MTEKLQLIEPPSVFCHRVMSQYWAKELTWLQARDELTRLFKEHERMTNIRKEPICRRVTNATE